MRVEEEDGTAAVEFSPEGVEGRVSDRLRENGSAHGTDHAQRVEAAGHFVERSVDVRERGAHVGPRSGRDRGGRFRRRRR